MKIYATKPVIIIHMLNNLSLIAKRLKQICGKSVNTSLSLIQFIPLG